MSWLRSATTTTGQVVDIELLDTRISQVVSATGTLKPGEVDLKGQVIMASFVEPHAHLDKALTASLAENPTGDLLGAIEAIRRVFPTMTVEGFTARAEAALQIHLGYGTTHVRSHVDVSATTGMRGLQALTEVRDRWSGLVDVQVVALVGHPLDGPAGEDLKQALQDGADVAGGCPHLDDDPYRAVEICLDAAGAAGKPLDLHTDETLNVGMLTLEYLADLVLRTGFAHGVTASHCVSLGVQPVEVQQRVAEKIAAAGISIVALPQTNLFLQGRDSPVAKPRGLTAVQALRQAGANVAAGGDNLRDPFHPVGRGDALEVAALMVTSGHLRPLDAVESVSSAPRIAMNLAPVSISVGSPADLVALPGSDLLQALAAAPVQRTVWRSGRIVAKTTVQSEICVPPSREVAS